MNASESFEASERAQGESEKVEGQRLKGSLGWSLARAGGPGAEK